MDTKNIENYLNSFGKQVVKGAKANLQKEKGKTELAGTIKFKVVRTDTGFSTQFFMADYGTYLDEGVSGNKKKQSFKDYKGTTRTSSYSYTTKGPPIDILSKWIKRKGIKPKGLGRGRSKKTGQFVSGFAYLISRKIKRDGIKSLAFFQKPLGIEYKKLQKNLLKEVKLDIETYLTTFYRPK
jgi:hypothetical protein|tara:strand:+ start:288 stop:833 length:546 start_codon:yes stop_codon:yes gene_type:complete